MQGVTTAPVYFDRDVSWLSFNYRVLQEAANPAVPLYERIRFLSIFSSNLDEFFRVRMPGLLALHALKLTDEEAADPTLRQTVQETVLRYQHEFGLLLTNELLPALRDHNIHLYYGEPIPPVYHPAMTDQFYSRVLAFLQPVWLTEKHKEVIFLEDNALYFAISVTENDTERSRYAVLNIPRAFLPRFVLLPQIGETHAIVFLDDIIRHQLGVVFPGYRVTGCYSFKINRDADSTLADEFSGEIDEKVAQMIESREKGLTSRFLFDAAMPAQLRQFLANYFSLTTDEMVEGGRYHNLRDLDELPNPTNDRLTYPPRPPLPHPDLNADQSLFSHIARKDHLLHFPYQSYNPILRFFNEAAIDPHVCEIYVTLYRIASDSFIANALISAAKNGKQVTVFVELKARFDEANNLKWAKKMKAAGVRLVYSIPSLKVHAKIALVKRKHGLNVRYFGLLATGNFNERTARFYTDDLLMTSHPGITRDLDLLFAYLQNRELPTDYQFISYEHILVAQFNLVPRFIELIDREIAHKQAGRPARIIIKLNNLQEQTMIDKLYEASQAGVQVDLIVRSICCLVPGVAGLSDNITVRRIVDRYLEHGRTFIFHNNGQPETYLGSADWMNRNLHRRIEVCCPVYDPALQTELRDLIEKQLLDNQQARFIRSDGTMESVQQDGKPVRSQEAIYAYL